MNLHYIKSEAKIESMLEASMSAKVFLLKHSTRCEVSEKAFREFEAFAKSNEEVDTYVVRVIEERPLSQKIAAMTNVVHKSPQVLVFKDGKVVWNDSHFNLTEGSLQQALAD